MKKKSILCKLGIHSVDKEQFMVRRNRKNYITSRSAFCKRCEKKLYHVDRYGKKRRVGLYDIWMDSIVVRMIKEDYNESSRTNKI